MLLIDRPRQCLRLGGRIQIYLLFSDGKWVTEGVYNPENELSCSCHQLLDCSYISVIAQVISWDAVGLSPFWV